MATKKATKKTTKNSVKNTTKNNSSKARTIAFAAIALAVLAVIIVMVFLDSSGKNNSSDDKPLTELELSTEGDNEISFDDFE